MHHTRIGGNKTSSNNRSRLMLVSWVCHNGNVKGSSFIHLSPDLLPPLIPLLLMLHVRTGLPLLLSSRESAGI